KLILAGQRNWPAHLPLEAFLLSTMRSTADNRRNVLRNNAVDYTQNESPQIATAAAQELDDPSHHIENAQYFGHKLETLQEHFKDDAAATQAMTDRALGNEPRPTPEYKAAVKRLQRQGAKLLDEKEHEPARANKAQDSVDKFVPDTEFGEYD